MNVLVICQYFPPENRIGAVRPSRIAKYLNRYEDVDVSVLTVEPLGLDASSLSDGFASLRVLRASAPQYIKRINDSFRSSMATSAEKGNIGPAVDDSNHLRYLVRKRVKGILFDIREHMLNHSYSRKAIDILKREKIIYDVIISTYNTEFGHTVGLWYKREHPDAVWITDYRDPLWGSYSSPKQVKLGKRFVRRMSADCDAITVVSRGIIDIHDDDFCGTPVFIIPNGYDLEDVHEGQHSSGGERLRIVYTGELYNGRRDLTPLFRSIETLVSSKRVHYEDIEIVYAGRSENCFMSQLEGFPCINHECRGLVSRQEALSLQANADILLLASWCEPNETEVLTGKFYEYLSMRKPIVCLIAGSASGCRLTKIINEHALGISYEAANDSEDSKRLCEYIEEQVKAKQLNGKAVFHGDEEFVSRFDYKVIANDFYELMTTL